MAELLEIRDIAKSREHVPVLRGVNLSLAEGEVLGLVGANGVGKSTLMAILAGDLRPDTGQMRLSGEPYAPHDNDEARRHGVGIIRQQFRLDPGQTVAQAIFRESFHAGRPHEELRRPAAQLLRDVGTEISADTLLGDLRRAEHAIIESVRMLAEDAQVVIMDEVGSTFNVREIDDLHFITSRLTSQGRAVIYISHRLTEVKAVSDRVVVLREGRVSAELDPYRVSTDDIAEAMIDRRPGELVRVSHVVDEPVLEVSGLRVADAVHGVDLKVRRGEVVGLVGARRGGMYELVGALVGQFPMTAGTVLVQGEPRVINSPADATALRIGYFSDDDDELGLSNSESIARNLMIGGWDEGVDFETEVAALRDVIETIQRLNVRAVSIQRGVGDLSGGDRQKIALTRWMTEDRDVLILNEPTRGLDIGAREDVLQILGEHTEAGRSAIILSSDLEDIVAWCDRVVVMRDGVIVDDLSTQGLSADALDSRVHPLPQGTRTAGGSTAFG